MAIPHYLAMTAAEMHAAASLPAQTAWMACHFSPYSTGLTNLPRKLPAGSLLILNDRTPIRGHDPGKVAKELEDIIGRFQCSSLLLDFQNPPNDEAREICAYLAENIHCPIAISHLYALPGTAVFLPPVPLTVPLKEHIASWDGYKIWLETAPERQRILLKTSGVEFCGSLPDFPGGKEHTDERLHCHYRIHSEESAVCFSLRRTGDDLAAMLEDAEQLGIQAAVGLYQEMLPAGNSR